MAALIVFLLTLGAILSSYLLNGLVLSKLWAWFVVPFGIPPISISWAIGIAIVVSFASTHESIKKNQDVDTAATITQAFLRPLFALFAGWVAHEFMT